MIHKIITLVLPLGLLCQIGFPQETYTLQQLLSRAEDNIHQLENNRILVQRAQARNTSGFAGNLPEITLSGSGQYDLENSKLLFFDGGEQGASNASNYSAGGSIDITYPLYEGGAKVHRKALLQNELEDAQVQYNLNKQEVLSQLLSQLILYDLHSRQSKVYAADTAYWRDLLALRQKMLDLGRGERSDVTQIRAELNNSRNQLNRSLQAKEIARTRVERWSFIDQEDSINLTEFTETLSDQALEPSSPTLNPQLNAAQIQQSIAQQNLALSQSNLLPTVSLFAGYGYNWSRNAVGILLSNQNYGGYLGLDVSWTLYSGNQRKIDQQSAKLNQLAASENVKSVNRELAYEEVRLVNAIKKEREILDNERTQSQILLEQYEQFQQKYKAGQIDILEVLNYRRQYRLSQLNIEQSKSQLQQYLLELARVRGHLSAF